MRLGLSNAAIGEYTVALEFLTEALAFYVELGDLAKRRECLQSIGKVQGKAGLYQVTPYPPTRIPIPRRTSTASMRLRVAGYRCRY
eukprot:3521821-Rhodomonas_salina.1